MKLHVHTTSTTSRPLSMFPAEQGIAVALKSVDGRPTVERIARVVASLPCADGT